MTQVVGKLNSKVTTYDTIPRILSIATTYGTHEGRILVQEVIYTNHNLASLVLKELLAEIYVTNKVVLVIVVRKADILVVVHSSGERKALPEYPLQRSRSRMVEVLVSAATCRERLLSIVISAIPLDSKVDILRDIATEREHSVVTHIACDVVLTIDHRRGTCPAITSHKVKVTLNEVYGETVADMRTQLAIAIHILVCRVLQWIVVRTVDCNSLGVIGNRLTNIVLCELT